MKDNTRRSLMGLAVLAMASLFCWQLMSGRRGDAGVFTESSSSGKHQELLDAKLPLLPGSREKRESVPASAFESGACRWFVAEYDHLESPSTRGSSLIGSVTLRTRAIGGQWNTTRASVAGGVLDYSSPNDEPIEYELLSFNLNGDFFALEAVGRIAVGADEFRIELTKQPMVLLRDAQTGKALEGSIQISETAMSPSGAKPVRPRPLPIEIDHHRITANNPFECSILDGFQDPVVGAVGFSWGRLPGRVMLKGGSFGLGLGHDYEITLNLPEGLAVVDASAIDIVLYDFGSVSWGSCALAMQIPSDAIQSRIISGATLTLDGVGGDVVEVAVAILPRSVDVLSGSASVKGVEHTSPILSGKLRVQIYLGTQEGLEVEGYIKFASREDADSIQSIWIDTLSAQVRGKMLAGVELKKTNGFVREGNSSIKWSCKGLLPGEYDLYLYPISYHVKLTVFPGLPTQYSSIDIERLERYPVAIQHLDARPPSGKCVWSVGSYDQGIGPGKSPLFRSLKVTGEDLSEIQVLAPMGSMVHVAVSTKENGGGGARFEALPGAGGEISLNPSGRLIVVKLISPIGAVEMPAAWWTSQLRGLGKDEVEHDLGIVFPPRGRSIGLKEFTRWGSTLPERFFSLLNVYVPSGVDAIKFPGATGFSELFFLELEIESVSLDIGVHHLGRPADRADDLMLNRK